MAREVHKFSEEAVWYVPDIEGNRDDPDPFAVEIVPLTAAELRQLEQGSLGKMTRGQEPNFVARAQRMQDKLIAKNVLRVKAYACEDAETGERIVPTTGAELVAAVKRTYAGELAVLEDILTALQMRSKLDEGLLGKLSSQSGSGSQATKTPGTGGAPAAAGTTPAPSPTPTGAGSGTATATVTPPSTGSGIQP